LRTVAFDEIRRIIREEEPPKPSTRVSTRDAATTAASVNRRIDPWRLRQVIRGELDWIVMKCLEKDRNRRYDTANGLALDLGRYLKNEQVHACPPTLAYRLRKFTRRHRAAIGTAGLVGAITIAGCAMTVWQAIRATSARAEAARAELALSKSRHVAAEERANAIAHDLETLNKANSLIESGRSRIDFSEWAKAEADLTAALMLRPDHSSAWLSRGQLYARLHLWDLASADFQEASTLQDHGSIESLYFHSIIRLRVGDEAGFHAVCERMIREIDPHTDRRGWEGEAIARACLLAPTPILEPGRFVVLTQHAVEAGRSPLRLASLGTALYRAGQYRAGLNALRESRAAEPGWAAWTESVMAMIHHRLGEPERARDALRSAADSIARRYEQWCDHFAASANAQWSHDAQAELYFREATKLIEGVEPKDDPLRWTHRGDSLAALGRNNEARASYQRAIELSPAGHIALTRRAELFARIGDWGNAFNDYDRLMSQQPDDASLTNELSWKLCTSPDPKYRDYRRAAELARRAVALDATASKHWNTLALALYRVADWPGANRAVLKSMELTDAGDVRNWLLLAMCQWRLDQEHRAR
jgi:tetratricopeptide (TPR) repeat protein